MTPFLAKFTIFVLSNEKSLGDSVGFLVMAVEWIWDLYSTELFSKEMYMVTLKFYTKFVYGGLAFVGACAL